MKNSTIILLFITIFVLFILIIPMPYDTSESYTEREPYIDSVCNKKLPTDTDSLIEKGIKSIIEQDIKKGLEECYDVTKYRNVEKTRSITKHKPLFFQWIDNQQNTNHGIGFDEYEFKLVADDYCSGKSKSFKYVGTINTANGRFNEAISFQCNYFSTTYTCSTSIECIQDNHLGHCTKTRRTIEKCTN
jgi:hypothetical protein